MSLLRALDMTRTIHLLILVATATIAKAATDVLSKPNCQEFSRGVTFDDSQALGTWHLLHYRTQKTRGSGEVHCVEFSVVDDAERKNLSDSIGKLVNGLKWERLTLKMQIPCAHVQSNRTRTYFLEKIEGNGSYRTLQVSSGAAKAPSEYHLYPMQLKLVEPQHLAMMDCNERFVFVMGREPPTPGQRDPRLQALLETYWPEDQ